MATARKHGPVRRQLVRACVAASVVLVAGCGGGASHGGSGGSTAGSAGTGAATTKDVEATSVSVSTAPVDPCALLTDADVNAGFALSDLNSAIDNVTRTPNPITPDTSSCTFAWTAANGSSSNFALYVYPASVYEGLETGGAVESVPEIPGAYKTPDGFFVAAGPLTLSITGVVSTPASGKLLQEAAAKTGG
jgi:hypothetical protein